jgi:hypothetical protein
VKTSNENTECDLILPGHSLTMAVNVTWEATLNPTTDLFTGDIRLGTVLANGHVDAYCIGKGQS